MKHHFFKGTISAPGEAVWRAYRSVPIESNDKVAPSCGTSYSTANVAGVAALWLSHYGREKLINQFDNDTKLQFVFKELVIETAIKPSGWDKDEYGAGIVNAQELLNKKPENARDKAKSDYIEYKETKEENVDSGLNDIEKTYYKMMEPK